MQRKLVSALLATCLVLSSVPILLHLSPLDEAQILTQESTSLDFDALTEKFGERIPVVVKFENGMTADLNLKLLEMNIEFTLGSARVSHVGPYYLLEGNQASLEGLVDLGVVSDIAAQTTAEFLQSPRDVSIPEINADDVWASLDDFGRNVTGEDILIADLDSGVDWRHPDLWFADGGSFSYVESTTTGFVNGTDAVDLNGDFALSADETVYSLDLNGDGYFNVTTEWLWADNVTQNGFPDPGEPFFVVNDTSGNGLIDGWENVTMLGTPKTRYIVEMDGNPSPSLQVWDREVNLTSSTHRDTMANGGGHGTAVAGILMGGQLGYRNYVGVAPSAELMMIRVIGDQDTTLSIEAGLAYANATGADVILIEIGSWTYHYLDGSNNVEDIVEHMIDLLVADGIPVIAPSGNLGSSDKHAMFTTAPGAPYQASFAVPPAGGEIAEDINNVYITVLSVNSTDFQTCNFSLIMDRSSFALPPITVYLQPGVGYGNFVISPGPVNFVVESFISQSSRGTSMLAIWIHGVIPTITIPPFHQLNVTSPDATLFHCYISDDQSSWSGGCVWTSDVSNAYQITWPSTADSAISVASYNTRYGIVGDLATYSSRGPRVDEVRKQTIAAPGGYDIITTYSNGTPYLSWYNNYGGLPFDVQFGSYRLFSGTSAAGPHVAGCAALLLQADPISGSQVKTIIESTARSDGFTGAVPNDNWGAGKLDVYAATAVVLADVDPPEFGLHTRTPNNPIDTESILIEIEVTDVSGVDTVILSYNNGTLWMNITMSWNGVTYNATIPAYPNGTTIEYRFYANDTLGFWATSSIFSYTVGSVTTTTTGPGSTTTDTTTSGGITPPPDGELDTLRLALLLTGVMILIVVYIIYNRRRSR